MSIILIGMPSCGKSTLGVLLAKQLGYKFVDADLLIQESEKKLLCEIIAEEGNEKFIEIEGKINSSIEDKNAVISTGGSVVYSDMAMKHLKTLGTVVYLRISYEEMCKRLGDFSHRGIVMLHGENLKDMYYERKPLYEKYADVIVSAESSSLTESLNKLLLSENIKNLVFKL